MQLQTLQTRYRRQLLFGTVGGLCFVVQYLALSILMHFEAGPAWQCNAAAFLLSTQLNCLLSQCLTWKSTVQVTRAEFWQRFMKYNGTALVSLTFNTAGFSIAHHLTEILAVSQISGTLLSSAFTFTVCNRFIFRIQEAAS